MVVNGSKSGKNPLLPFFFELWSNNKKTAEKHKILCIFRRFYLYRALSLFGVEHVLGKDEVTSSNLVISSRKNVPYNGGRFFWSWGASPSKSTPNKEECFFLPLSFISLKNISYNEGRFFGAGGISVKFHIKVPIV